MKWTINSKKTLLNNPWLEVQENNVTLPNGNSLKYITLPARNHAASIIALNTKGEILIQQEYNLGADATLYQLPGGSILIDEEPVDGARRELQEESGWLAGKLTQLGWYYTDNRRSNQKMFVFLANDLIMTEKKLDDGEVITDEWISESKIDDLIASGDINNVHLLAAWTLFGAYKTKISKL